MNSYKRTLAREKTVRGLLAAGDKEALERYFETFSAWEAAQMASKLSRREQCQLLLLIKPQRAAGLVEELPDEQAARIISDIDPATASDIVEEMVSSESVDLLQNLSVEKKEGFLKRMTPSDREEALELLAYPPDCAGGLMKKEFITFDQRRRVGEVLVDMRRHAELYARFPVTYLYVVDEANRLVGVLQLRDLILKDEALSIEEIMIRDPIHVPAEMDQEEVGQIFEECHYLAVPVVDAGGRLVGVISQSDILEVMEQEAGEDLLKFSGIVGGEETRDMPFFRRSFRRLSWLSVNILLNLLAASVIWFYEDTLMAAIGIAMFLPIISDMSGCSGNQAIAVGIRELATGRSAPKDFLRVWWAEASVGLFNGFLLGAQLGLIAFLLRDSWVLGLVVGGALWVNTVLSMTLGSLIPLFLKGIGKDPALASAPILTTLTDLCGFFLVLFMASQVLT